MFALSNTIITTALNTRAVFIDKKSLERRIEKTYIKIPWE